MLNPSRNIMARTALLTDPMNRLLKACHGWPAPILALATALLFTLGSGAAVHADPVDVVSDPVFGQFAQVIKREKTSKACKEKWIDDCKPRTVRKCKNVVRQDCRMAPDNTCRDKLVNHCRPTPENVCHYVGGRQQCRVQMRHKCTPRIRRVCDRRLVRKCQPVTRQVCSNVSEPLCRKRKVYECPS